jgi:hypothetical protein
MNKHRAPRETGLMSTIYKVVNFRSATYAAAVAWTRDSLCSTHDVCTLLFSLHFDICRLRLAHQVTQHSCTHAQRICMYLYIRACILFRQSPVFFFLCSTHSPPLRIVHAFEWPSPSRGHSRKVQRSDKTFLGCLSRLSARKWPQ